MGNMIYLEKGKCGHLSKPGTTYGAFFFFLSFFFTLYCLLFR